MEFAVARIRLPDYKKQWKRKYDEKSGGKDTANQPTKWKHAAKLYSEQLTDRARTGAIRHHSAALRQDAVRKISHYWPSIADLEIRSINAADALKFFADAKTGEGPFLTITLPKGRRAQLGDFRGGSQSASAYNRMLGVARDIVAIAQDEDAKKNLPAFKSPFEKIDWAKSAHEKLVMPSDEEWFLIVKEIAEESPGRDKLDFERRGLLAEFMSISGARIGELVPSRVRHPKDPVHPGFRWTDIHIGYNVITNAKKRKGKEFSTRSVPWIGGAEELMERIRRELFKGNENALVFEGIGKTGVWRALKSAIKGLNLDQKLKKFTQHKIRHLFATKCAEANIDWKALAEWLGHEDGGLLAAKLYSHFRKECGEVKAARVCYGHQAAETKSFAKRPLINGKEFTEAEVYEMAAKFESLSSSRALGK
jgi:integrase